MVSRGLGKRSAGRDARRETRDAKTGVFVLDVGPCGNAALANSAEGFPPTARRRARFGVLRLASRVSPLPSNVQLSPLAEPY